MNAPRNALELPLTGVRVVEASAGTGKTFTLATLYLRLVLERALRPEQIVVATFTRAAAAELSTRLRERLRRAAVLLAQDGPTRARDDDDGETQATREAITQALAGSDVDVETLRKRAREAELTMDTAVIGTLHGFCHRVLGEFGFETRRALAPLELLDDTRALQSEVIEDFWRAGSADEDTARVLAETWSSPQKLAMQVADPRWRGRAITTAASAPASMPQLRERRGELSAWLDALRNAIAGWDEASLRETESELEACISHAGARAARSRGLRELRNWAVSTAPSWPLPGSIGKALNDLSPAVMQTMKSCKRLPEGLAFDAVADLRKAIADIEEIDAAAGALVLCEARAFLERELPARMHALGKLGHDQAIDALVAALDDPHRGPGAVGAIRQRWPAALIDEFQDTDPAQWRILQKLFGCDEGALILVGDPKQAIYGFRGGDVHAYLAARACADGDPMPLDESQRAGTGINAGINALFARADAFVDKAIAYRDVHSAGRVAHYALLRDGKPMPGLRLWQLPASGKTKKDGTALAWNKGDAEHAIEVACVARVVELLTAAQAGTAQLRRGDGSTRALRPGDLAVLVNDNRQAHAMQRALGNAGVPAASCLRASVYASEEAGDLRLLLEALRDPADAKHVRAAQASLLIGADAQQIAHSLHDSVALDALLEQTAAWANQAQRHGPLALLHALIADAAPRLLATPGGERRVVNYLQLAELLQQQIGTCFGLDELCDAYARELADASDNTDSDAARLRLETDAHAVQIATIHAAKGLEYGVVFLPYALLGRNPARENRWPELNWYHEADQARVAIGSEVAEDIVNAALDEVLAEEVRKFYVGITRACAACVLPWGSVNLGEHTAAHWLLHVAGRESPVPFDAAGCERALKELAARAPQSIVVEALPDATTRRWTSQRDDSVILRARVFNKPIERDWQTWSFSRLVRGSANRVAADPLPGSGDADTLARADEAGYEPGLAGARFGTAVHAAFEDTDFTVWRDATGVPESERGVIERGLRAQGLADDDAAMKRAVDVVAACIRGALNASLPCGTSLCDVPPAQRKAEIEFHLTLEPARSVDLYALLHRHGYQQQRGGVTVQRLHGLLTGKIDLTFAHAGRFHLVDWKTNRCAPYDDAALRAEIAAHDYDLQWLIYTLALHRWLRQQLSDYDYDRHVGETYYLFVRGMAEGAGMHVDRPPRVLIEAMDAMFGAGEVNA